MCVAVPYLKAWRFNFVLILSHLTTPLCAVQQPVKSDSMRLPLLLINTSQIHLHLTCVTLLSCYYQMCASFAEVWGVSAQKHIAVVLLVITSHASACVLRECDYLPPAASIVSLMCCLSSVLKPVAVSRNPRPHSVVGIVKDGWEAQSMTLCDAL